MRFSIWNSRQAETWHFHLLGDSASSPASVSWMLSPLQVVQFPITMAEIVFFVVGCVMLRGALQGDSLDFLFVRLN